MNKEEYVKFLQSTFWKELRSSALIVFKNKCFFCGSTNRLNLHHTRYCKKNLGNSNRKPYNNLRWLLLICNDCHNKIHQIQKETGLTIYRATKLYKNTYFKNKGMSLTKKYIHSCFK